MYQHFGPIFGDVNTGACAILVRDNSNQNNANTINFENHTYSNVNVDPYYGFHNQGTNFSVVEIEIYQQDQLVAI
jgi:hypothetical protein